MPGAFFGDRGKTREKPMILCYNKLFRCGAPPQKDRGGAQPCRQKEEFIEIFREHVHRDGGGGPAGLSDQQERLFFTSPASARYHGAYAGGLCEHSLNVYHCLTDYLARERVTDLYGLEYSPESIALVALLHDVCKIGCYKPSTRNVKGEDGKWDPGAHLHL